MEKGRYTNLDQEFYVDKNKLLGKGQFGYVYKGYYLTQNKIIAVKFLTQEVLENSDYKRQLAVMDSLTQIRHPNIMDYYGYREKPEGLYCFVEFCGGGSVKDLIKGGNKVSQIKAISMLRQILQGMVYINSLNKVHRDLKPDNLLLDQNHNIKIADFGLARDVGVDMTKGACTPLYAAPQVLNQDQYDQRCDVWSAGLILYQLLMGKQYFKHVKTKKQLLQEIFQFSNGKRKITYPSQLDPEWNNITNYMLTYYSIKRPKFVDVLEKFKSLQPAMMKRINEKYGYVDEDEEFDQGLRLTKTISPYLVGAKKGKNMDEKIKEEQSYTNFNNLRKYLNHFRLKSDILRRLVEQFTTNPYPYLKNVYKYLLMFLSTASYISKVQKKRNQIKDRRIQTPDKTITVQSFTVDHINQVKELLEDIGGKLESSQRKFEKILAKQINNKILDQYMKRESQRKVIEEVSQLVGNIAEIIEKTNRNEFIDENKYLKMYKVIMNLNDVKLTKQNLTGIKLADLKTYAYIRIIGHMDQVFEDDRYKQDDYMRQKKQVILNQDSENLIKFILEIND